MKKKILIAGGSGLIGTRLMQFLDNEHYHFNILSRSDKENKNGVSYYKWNTGKHELDLEALSGVVAVINLAGAGIADKRWTVSRKKEIIDSRVESIITLGKAMSSLDGPLPLYIGASAVGYYGNQGDQIMKENDAAGAGFLAEVTEQWELAHGEVAASFERNIILRIGIVLSHNGGALKEILKPAAAGVYGYFGNGGAYYSWVHIDDICLMVQRMLEDSSYSGIYNATAPEPITIKTLVQSVKKAKNGIGLVMPVPGFALKIAMGEMTQMLTDSMRAIPEKLLTKGHRFLFTNPVAAIEDILDRKV